MCECNINIRINKQTHIFHCFPFVIIFIRFISLYSSCFFFLVIWWIKIDCALCEVTYFGWCHFNNFICLFDFHTSQSFRPGFYCCLFFCLSLSLCLFALEFFFAFELDSVCSFLFFFFLHQFIILIYVFMFLSILFFILHI